MLALQKTLDSSWEIARVSLRQDLDTIQTVLNRRWGATFGASNTLSVSSISGAAALARVNDTNVTLTLGGSPTVSLLAATTITVGWAGTLAAGRLNSNVVQGVTNDTNVTGSIAAQVLTLAWAGTLAAGRLNANVVQAAVNDTNVTGSIAAQTLTLGWAGTLAAARLNANVVQSISNDTNITGSIAAQVLTLAWAGTLSVLRGGLGVGTLTTNGLLYGNGTSAVQAGAALTSGKIPIATTNGVLIDGQTPLAGTKVYYTSDTSGGPVTRKLTFTDGILTSET